MAAIVGSSALLERIKNTKLINLYDRETSISASTLWANQPVFVHVVRRPGCKLCRNQALDLNLLRPEFDRRKIKLIAVSHQDNSANEFAEKYFGSKDLYLDPTKDFYATVWDGKLKHKGPAAFFNIAFWRNYKQAGNVEGNMKGDGYNLGGLLLIAQGDGGVKWTFKEENFGDRPTKAQIIDAIDALVPMQGKTLPAAQPVATPAVAVPAAAAPAAAQKNGAVVNAQPATGSSQPVVIVQPAVMPEQKQ